MSTSGFNLTQIRQLKGLFAENKKDIIDQVASGVAEVVNSLSQTIKESEERTTSTLRAEIKEVRNELKSDIKKLDEKLDNFISITPTKYQVDRLEKAAFG